jgi:hypothetical protein
MRAYTVATVAVTLGVPAKWLDNVLTHYTIPGVSRAKQGIARRLNQRAVLVLATALELSRGLRLPVSSAISLAGRLVEAGEGDEDGVMTLNGIIRITIDFPRIESMLAERLAHAVEVAPMPRRGRPPSRR